MAGPNSAVSFENAPAVGSKITIGEFKTFLGSNNLDVPKVVSDLTTTQKVEVIYAELRPADAYFKFYLKFEDAPEFLRGVLHFEQAGVVVEYGTAFDRP